MMEGRTPSPPRRVHTPPAPLHGAKHDTYEPYSPRRSSRVAAQRDQSQQQTSPARFRLSRTTRDITPTTSRKSAKRATLGGLSPPSSPISPNKHPSPRSTRRAHFGPTAADSDSDHLAPTPARRLLSVMEPRGMLPTPAKTPRKRSLQNEDSLQSTARVLFANRPATIDDAMPTPRKSRKSRMDVFALNSFGDQMEQTEEKIEIYTDSKDRVPTADEDEENPFVTNKSKGKGKAKTNGTRKLAKVDAQAAKMQAAVDRDEGMIFLFRGKKVLRKFHDGPRPEASDEDSTEEIRRSAGHEARRPLTRSAVKPRLLFQEELRQREAAMGPDDVDEEAVTDIEVYPTTPSTREAREAEESRTHVEHQEATPPPTVHKKQQISFNSWRRVKPASRGSSASQESKKRGGDTLEGAAEKRTRSEPSSAMSID